MINLSRRRFLFCAPAVILTPGLLMRGNPYLGLDVPKTFAFLNMADGRARAIIDYGEGFVRTAEIDLPLEFRRRSDVIAMTGKIALRHGFILPKRIVAHRFISNSRDLPVEDGHSVPITRDRLPSTAPAVMLMRGGGDPVYYEDEIVYV